MTVMVAAEPVLVTGLPYWSSTVRTKGPTLAVELTVWLPEGAAVKTSWFAAAGFTVNVGCVLMFVSVPPEPWRVWVVKVAVPDNVCAAAAV